MKTLLYFACVFFLSCTVSKNHLQNPCAFNQASGGYTKISDSDFLWKKKGLGRSYLNLVIDSCQRISNVEINLVGHVTFPEGKLKGDERKMPDVDIIQAIQADKEMLKYRRYLGKTDETGKFNIIVSTSSKKVVLLLDKQNFNYTSILLSY